MNERYCQSCAMPMGDTDDLYGTEADGSKSTEYCTHCYAKGRFTADATMDEMISFCVPHMVSANAGMTEENARNMMHAHFPMLKRWNNQ